MKISQKINRFHVVLTIVLILLAVLVIVSVRGTFSAISLAGEVDESLLSSKAPRVEKAKIDKALESINNREFTPLDL